MQFVLHMKSQMGKMLSKTAGLFMFGFKIYVYLHVYIYIHIHTASVDVCGQKKKTETNQQGSLANWKNCGIPENQKAKIQTIKDSEIGKLKTRRLKVRP